jgi:hypothetical protein
MVCGGIDLSDIVHSNVCDVRVVLVAVEWERCAWDCAVSSTLALLVVWFDVPSRRAFKTWTMTSSRPRERTAVYVLGLAHARSLQQPCSVAGRSCANFLVAIPPTPLDPPVMAHHRVVVALTACHWRPVLGRVFRCDDFGPYY